MRKREKNCMYLFLWVFTYITPDYGKCTAHFYARHSLEARFQVSQWKKDAEFPVEEISFEICPYGDSEHIGLLPEEMAYFLI